MGSPDLLTFYERIRIEPGKDAKIDRKDQMA